MSVSASSARSTVAGGRSIAVDARHPTTAKAAKATSLCVATCDTSEGVRRGEGTTTTTLAGRTDSFTFRSEAQRNGGDTVPTN